MPLGDDVGSLSRPCPRRTIEPAGDRAAAERPRRRGAIAMPRRRSVADAARRRRAGSSSGRPRRSAAARRPRRRSARAAPSTIASSSASRSVRCDDRALDLREPLEQLLAAAQRAHELERAHGLGAARGAMPRSSAASSTLNGSPSRASASRRLVVERRAARAGTSPSPGTLELAPPVAPAPSGRAAREADRGDDRAVADDRADLGLERLGGALDARPQRAALVLARAEPRRGTR